MFSHLIIDNIEVYENHEEYIKERIQDIETIEIITRSMTEMIWETMQSLQEYLNRAIPALTDLVENSYKSFSDETWTGIGQLAEGMQWILQFKETTDSASKKPMNWLSIKESIEVCEGGFIQLLEAIETKDTILITDILSYEITPAYETLKHNIETALNDKGFLKDVN